MTHPLEESWIFVDGAVGQPSSACSVNITAADFRQP